MRMVNENGVESEYQKKVEFTVMVALDHPTPYESN